MPDINNYINGAVGPNSEVQSSQEEGELETGISSEHDAPLVDAASQEKEEMDSVENAQASQQMMPVSSSAFTGSNHNVFGPMVPMTQGAYPIPEAADGYGGNAVVRSSVPETDKNANHNGKESKGNKKQCINGRLCQSLSLSVTNISSIYTISNGL